MRFSGGGLQIKYSLFYFTIPRFYTQNHTYALWLTNLKLVTWYKFHKVILLINLVQDYWIFIVAGSWNFHPPFVKKKFAMDQVVFFFLFNVFKKSLINSGCVHQNESLICSITTTAWKVSKHGAISGKSIHVNTWKN